MILFFGITFFIMFFLGLRDTSPEIIEKNRILGEKFDKSYFRGKLIGSEKSGRAVHIILKVDSMKIMNNCCYNSIMIDRKQKNIIRLSVSRECMDLIEKGDTIFKDSNTSDFKYYDNGIIKKLF